MPRTKIQKGTSFYEIAQKPYVTLGNLDASSGAKARPEWTLTVALMYCSDE